MQFVCTLQVSNFDSKRSHIFFATTDTCGNIGKDYAKLISLVARIQHPVVGVDGTNASTRWSAWTARTTSTGSTRRPSPLPVHTGLLALRKKTLAVGQRALRETASL